MIVNGFINAIVQLLNTLFDWFPTVDKLPTILGVDIDYQLEYYVGMFYRLADNFWLLGDLVSASLILLGYLTTKLILKLFLGSRYEH